MPESSVADCSDSAACRSVGASLVAGSRIMSGRRRVSYQQAFMARVISILRDARRQKSTATQTIVRVNVAHGGRLVARGQRLGRAAGHCLVRHGLMPVL